MTDLRYTNQRSVPASDSEGSDTVQLLHIMSEHGGSGGDKGRNNGDNSGGAMMQHNPGSNPYRPPPHQPLDSRSQMTAYGR